MSYCVDCNGQVETFISIHWSINGFPSVNTHNTRPGWVGLTPERLGCPIPAPCQYQQDPTFQYLSK